MRFFKIRQSITLLQNALFPLLASAVGEVSVFSASL
jgi:hypothetical protein